MLEKTVKIQGPEPRISGIFSRQKETEIPAGKTSTRLLHIFPLFQTLAKNHLTTPLITHFTRELSIWQKEICLKMGRIYQRQTWGLEFSTTI